MKNLMILWLTLVVTCAFTATGQDRAMTFEQAEKLGIPFQRLDSLYKSAVHSELELAVFKTPEEQESLIIAYRRFMRELGTFLKNHSFNWEKETMCFNRIYFSSEGEVDYFLYNFPPGQLAEGKEKEFKRLLNLFVQQNRFTLSADEGFAQCSPIKYSDK
ncbi:hypothetical protein [Pontibacter sp. H249]|uniref:hypothetical protein n=1 Tax=Pontibacter sp. H249 TaxID=3133420 RepID=UPI0030BA9598